MTNQRPSAEFKRLSREAGRLPIPGQPETLPLEHLQIAEAVFQPRTGTSEGHVRALMSAVRAKEGPLDAVVVWWSGQSWYLVDGHHRLEAYRRYNLDQPNRKITSTPVEVFAGSLPQAVQKATASNSKDRLSMTQREKSNAAWRSVCHQDDAMVIAELARDAGVTRPTIYAMRQCLKVLLAEHPKQRPLDLSWKEATDIVGGRERTDWDDEQQERQAQEWAAGLYRLFGSKLARSPDIAARAIQIYSPDLPKRLVEANAFEDHVRALHANPEWREAVEEETDVAASY